MGCEDLSVLNNTLESLAKQFAGSIGRVIGIPNYQEHVCMVDLGDEIAIYTGNTKIPERFRGVEIHIPIRFEWKNSFSATLLSGNVILRSGLVVPQWVADEAKMDYVQYTRDMMIYDESMKSYFDG